jgi:hypothetical protein
LRKAGYLGMICASFSEGVEYIYELAVSKHRLPMIELQKYFNELYDLKEPYIKLRFNNKTAFKSCVAAAFSKAIDLGVSLFKTTDEEEAYFKTASLRGVCEEIIVLLYMDTILKPDQNIVMQHMLSINLAKDLKSQEDFFQANHSMQPVLTSSLYSDVQTPQNAIATILTQKGINGNKLPPVEQMAKKVNLSELYSYMYRATSNFVHFNPGHLIRMGWGNTMKEATFKTSHFYKYYLMFNRFYISYLLVIFCKKFKGRLKLKGGILKTVKSLEKELDTYLTWPEIVTFEEMNIKRPSEIFTLLRLSQKRFTGN